MYQTLAEWGTIEVSWTPKHIAQAVHGHMNFLFCPCAVLSYFQRLKQEGAARIGTYILGSQGLPKLNPLCTGFSVCRAEVQ